MGRGRWVWVGVLAGLLFSSAASASALLTEAAPAAALPVEYVPPPGPDRSPGGWPAPMQVGVLLADIRQPPSKAWAGFEERRERRPPRPSIAIRFPERVFSDPLPPNLSPVTSEDTAPDPVRYRIAGTLATAAGRWAVYNGATAVAEFSPGPNDAFQPNRWHWGRCRTALARC